jgi:ABC-type molybdate transport system permease subunit
MPTLSQWFFVFGTGMAAGSLAKGAWSPYRLEAWWWVGPLICAVVVVGLQLLHRFGPTPLSRFKLGMIGAVGIVTFVLVGNGVVTSAVVAIGFAVGGLALGIESVEARTIQGDEAVENKADPGQTP